MEDERTLCEVKTPHLAFLQPVEHVCAQALLDTAVRLHVCFGIEVKKLMASSGQEV
jgi:hypothetical protein